MGADHNFVVTEIQNVIERETTKGWSFNTGLSDRYIMAINLGGIGEYDVNGQIIKVCENDVVLFPPRTARKCITDEYRPWHFISIGFCVKGLEGEEYVLDELPVVTRNVNRNTVSLLKKLSQTWSGKSSVHDLLCRTYLQEVLCNLIQINEAIAYNPAHYEKIEHIKNFINENYMKTLTVEELAAEAGLSQSHFRKIFREIVGMSATQYAINLRINKARDLLISGSVNVSEAAFLSGFNDVYYFSSMFKKVTGENPSKYLK